MTVPLPPHRRFAHSDYGLCVMAGCGARATTSTTLVIGGQSREAVVCARHAPTTERVPAEG